MGLNGLKASGAQTVLLGLIKLHGYCRIKYRESLGMSPLILIITKYD